MSNPDSWQYKSERFPIAKGGEKFLHFLNNQGSQGWEVVQVENDVTGKEAIVLMKRKY